MDETEVKREILRALRELSRRQQDTSAILALDLQEVADHLGIERSEVRNNLSDLLNEGFAEGFAETMTDRAIDGHCRITPAGLAELRRSQ